MASTLQLATEFILSLASARNPSDPALVIGIQGPQGSGKSYLCQQLEQSQQLKHLGIANVSLDDLYLPHDQLVRHAKDNPGNELLDGRGQAGTHDVKLGQHVLRSLKQQQVTTTRRIPRFDKSLFGGQGDRLDEREWTTFERERKIDVVLFEGWMVGFRSVVVQDGGLERVYQLATDPNYRDSKEVRELLGGIEYPVPFLARHRFKDLVKVNDELVKYDSLWNLVDAWVELKPEKLDYVWEWRLEQEHTMKAKNGGIGMTDEQVKTFISRYMPGYELFSSSSKVPKSSNHNIDHAAAAAVTDGSSSRGGGGGGRPLLTIEIGKQRQVVNIEETVRS